MCPRFLHRVLASMCAAPANHGIVSSHGGRVFVIGRLELVTGVSVVMVFGVRVRKTDRMDCLSPRHWHGTWTVSWTGDCGAPAHLCFWLVSNSWTWQKGRGDIDTFRPSRRQTETNRSQGTTSWKNSRRTTSAEKRCCSRHVGSSLFQFLGVTHHVPSMVWRDGPDWSDDSVVSTGGTRLDRRRKPECHVRAVCGCWTTGNKPGGWCECGHVLDTEGGQTYAQELHMETARSR